MLIYKSGLHLRWLLDQRTTSRFFICDIVKGTYCTPVYLSGSAHHYEVLLSPFMWKDDKFNLSEKTVYLLWTCAVLYMMSVLLMIAGLRKYLILWLETPLSHGKDLMRKLNLLHIQTCIHFLLLEAYASPNFPLVCLFHLVLFFCYMWLAVALMFHTLLSWSRKWKRLTIARLLS